MNGIKKYSPLVVAICLLMITTAVWALAPQTNTGGTTTGFITEYSIPVANSNPQHLAIETVGPPARIWFTMMDADAIGQLVVTSTVDFHFTTYPVTAGSEPYDIAYDENASLIWFTEPGGNRIGQLDVVTKVMTETAVPDNHSPWGIDVAPNGEVWFTEPAANQVVRYQPGSQTFTPFPYTLTGGNPDQIEVLNNTSVWITLPGVNRVAELRVGTAQYVNIPVNDPSMPTFPPGGLALDGSGPWITAPTMQRIGRHSPGTVAFWNWYQLPLTGDNLAYSETGDTKELWFTSMAAGKVGLLTLNNQGDVVSFGTHLLPTPNSEPVDIVVADDGSAWITESNGNQIATWQSPYFYQAFISFVSK
jgi:virginiamycin B lyase